jgi:regulator of nucleoside diphosphate kinase
MEPRTIRITENDHKKLREAMHSARVDGYRGSSYLQQLAAELERAEVVSPRDMPADVITMNSKVLLTDIASGEALELTLVYPQDSTTDVNNISVLAPIGTAMIGYRVGDVIEWDTPDGKTSLKVEKILYQPEAAGVFD